MRVASKLRLIAFNSSIIFAKEIHHVQKQLAFCLGEFPIEQPRTWILHFKARSNYVENWHKTIFLFSFWPCVKTKKKIVIIKTLTYINWKQLTPEVIFTWCFFFLINVMSWCLRGHMCENELNLVKLEIELVSLISLSTQRFYYNRKSHFHILWGTRPWDGTGYGEKQQMT